MSPPLIIFFPSVRSSSHRCRDGVIEARIDHEKGWVTSSEVLDLYCSEEPQKAFHK
jgi:SH3-like domain-containing protein